MNHNYKSVAKCPAKQNQFVYRRKKYSPQRYRRYSIYRLQNYTCSQYLLNLPEVFLPFYENRQQPPERVFHRYFEQRMFFVYPCLLCSVWMDFLSEEQENFDDYFHDWCFQQPQILHIFLQYSYTPAIRTRNLRLMKP